MGITEYIPSKCTFSVLICAFDEDSARVARRIQRARQQNCGLYTYNSTSGSPTPMDSMFDIVTRRYTTIVFVRPKLEAEPAVAILGRKAAPLRDAIAGAVATGTIHPRSPMTAYDPHIQILFSPRALDESDIYAPIADQVAAQL